MLRNTTLVQHGIFNEESDIRAHVGVEAGIVYVFSTNRALSVIDSGSYQSKPVYSYVHGEKIQTATGYVVPVLDLLPVEVHATDVIKQVGFVNGDYSKTSDKGKKAQLVVEKLLIQGRFPLSVHPKIITNADVQRKGIDLIVSGRWRIEVKCDWRAGMFDPAIHLDSLKNVLTGNVYLQTHECNPLQQW